MILVFGKTGQVGREALRLNGIFALGRKDADLSDPAACALAIRELSPKAVINAAAYTAVDKAEEEEAYATILNGDAPTAMALACAALQIPLVHISTDYVFSGTGEKPWSPDDPTFPKNAYGRSKLAGEKGIRNSGAAYSIVRTSWVVSAHGENFVKRMLQLSKTGDVLSIVNDQIGGPTPASHIATTCLRISKQLIKDPSKSGIYHYSGAPDVSWADFANEIFAQSQIDATVTPIRTVDYPTLAKRPLNSRLNCQATEQTFAIKRPNWRKGLNLILKELEVM